jgi:hypothetical protein
MNTAQLARVLRDFGVDPATFDLVHGTADEAYCLIRESDGWHVFYSERGQRTTEYVFDSECSASDAFIQLIASDPLTRLNAPRFPGL